MNIKGSGIAKATFEIVSPLTGFSVKSGRMTGNSTRLIDTCINIIFSGKTCLVQDHHLDGTHKNMNKNLFVRVEKRLYFEHKNVKDLLCFDRNNLAIYLFRSEKEKEAVEK